MESFLPLLLLGVIGFCPVAPGGPAPEPTCASLAFTSSDPVVRGALDMVYAGKFKDAEALLSANTNSASGEILRARCEAAEIIRRMRIEYSLDTERLLARVRKSVPDATVKEVERWAKETKSRYRMMDGRKMYFNRTPQNIFLFSEAAIKRRAQAGNAPAEADTKLLEHLKSVADEAERTGNVQVQPVHHKIAHTVTIPANTPGVKAGSLVRAWLPFPQEYRQQRDGRLISVSPQPKLIAPSGVDGNPVSGGAQRTVYFEELVKDPAKPIEFKLVFDYTCYAYYPKLDPALAQPLLAGWNNAFLGERLPHIVFTPEIRKQVARIVGKETNPLEKARRIFRWVSENVEWNPEDEYCIIPSFAIKGFTARRGDCGIQSTVFITMCRIAGIPARWQSGYERKPAESDWGMHDWSEIYIAPWGWLPADASYGIKESNDPRVAGFYCGHQDSYRLIINLDWGRELMPPKQSLRSEPADLQRGEVEVDGRNLYFNDWESKTEMLP